jgi:uncharacterized protein (DUF1800 family)
VFGETGNLDWRDICRLVIEHPMHASFFVTKLWSYFLPEPPSDAEREALEELYLENDYAIRPVLESILCSRSFFESTGMVKPPAVFMAGMCRARQRFMDDGTNWAASAELAGQRLYMPPDVGGWDHDRWLDSNTIRARWEAVYGLIRNGSISSSDWAAYDADETPAQAVDAALAFWGEPVIRSDTRAELEAFAARVVPAAPDATLRAQRQNALRQLLAMSPDYQVA